jgi:hypothetical protein
MTAIGTALLPEAGAADINANSQIAQSKGDANRGYWKDPVTGWVSVLPVGMNATQQLMDGYRPLQRFGFFFSSNGFGGWSPHNDPFLRLVEMNGLDELPAEQIVSLNWHREPKGADKQSHKLVWLQVKRYLNQGLSKDEALVAVFPQLADVIDSLRDWVCEFCPDKRFNQEVHLKKHESVVHQDDVRSRETRDSIAIAMREGSQKDSELMTLLAGLLGEVAKGNSETQKAVLQLVNGQLNKKD